MNKTCLLITGTNPGGQIQAPVGLIYMGTQLKKHGYPVEIFHVTDAASLAVCKEKIMSEDFLFVGCSIWMGPTSLDMMELTQAAKGRGFPTLWGGKFVTSLKDEALTEESVDVAVMGYAEETAVELADCIKAGKDYSGVAGIYYRGKGGEIIKTADRKPPPENLDEYDYDLGLIKDWSKYVVQQGGDRILYDPLESQRGCLFRCRFCFHCDDKIYSDSNKKTINSHSVDFVLKKAKELKDLTGATKITFCDDEFWINEARSLEIVEKLKAMGISLMFMRIRFSSINDNMLRRLQELGVTGIACGLESGNARVLKMMNKGLTLEATREKMRLLAKYPIIVNTVIILGNPTETKEEMLESIRFMMSLRKIKKNLNVLTFFYRPLPSTDFGRMAEEAGFKRPRHIRDWVNVSAENIFSMGHQWLPWYGRRDELNMKRKDDYFALNSILAEQLYGDKKRGLGMKLLRPLLYLAERLTYARIYLWDFRFPVDAKIGLFMYEVFKYFKGRKAV